MDSKMEIKGIHSNSVIEIVPVLVIGATLAGIGLAYADKDRTLVVERTSGPGQEFIGCFHPGERLGEATSSATAALLREELVQRNLLSAEEKLHLGALAPVLFNRIKQDRLRVRFLTEVIHIEQDQGGEYIVTLFDASGIRQIKSQYIVDTTSMCHSSPDYNLEIRSKKINAMLHHTDPLASLPAVEDENVEIIEGRFPGEVILKYRLDKTDDWPKARSKLHQYWIDRPAAFGSWTLAIVADAMEINTGKGPHTLADRRVWLPSCAYNNALQAIDEGFVFGKEGITHEAVSTN